MVTVKGGSEVIVKTRYFYGWKEVVILKVFCLYCYLPTTKNTNQTVWQLYTSISIIRKFILTGSYICIFPVVSFNNMLIRRDDVWFNSEQVYQRFWPKMTCLIFLKYQVSHSNNRNADDEGSLPSDLGGITNDLPRVNSWRPDHLKKCRKRQFNNEFFLQKATPWSTDDVLLICSPW